MPKTNNVSAAASFIGRNSDGWVELELSPDLKCDDKVFASFVRASAPDYSAAIANDKKLSEKRAGFIETQKAIRHNMAVMLLRRYPIAKSDWLTIPVGRTKWSLPTKFKATLGADLASWEKALERSGMKESAVRKAKERVLDKCRALAFPVDAKEAAHSALVSAYRAIAKLSGAVEGTAVDMFWDTAQAVWALGDGYIPDATRAALRKEIDAALEAAEDKREEKKEKQRKAAIDKAAKANSNKTPKVTGALVG